MLRDLRDSTSDRDAVRQAFATLHVAHAEAEEKYVYPKLRRKGAMTEHEAEHGEEEHAEGNEALLAVLELKGTDTQAFDDAVEELAKVVNHHLTEEELTILNPAREDVGEQVRADLGEQFATERNADRRRLRRAHERPPDRRSGRKKGLLDERRTTGRVALAVGRCRGGSGSRCCLRSSFSCFRTIGRLLDSMMSFFFTVAHHRDPGGDRREDRPGEPAEHGRRPDHPADDGRDQEAHEGLPAAALPLRDGLLLEWSGRRPRRRRRAARRRRHQVLQHNRQLAEGLRAVTASARSSYSTRSSRPSA